MTRSKQVSVSYNPVYQSRFSALSANILSFRNMESDTYTSRIVSTSPTIISLAFVFGNVFVGELYVPFADIHMRRHTLCDAYMVRFFLG